MLMLVHTDENIRESLNYRFYVGEMHPLGWEKSFQVVKRDGRDVIASGTSSLYHERLSCDENRHFSTGPHDLTRT